MNEIGTGLDRSTVSLGNSCFDPNRGDRAAPGRSTLTSDIRHIDARQLNMQLHDGGEIAVLDAREEGVFARRHLLLASCVPLSRLELLVDDLVPRRTARVVWCDDSDGTALLAARRMAALGYQDVTVL